MPDQLGRRSPEEIEREIAVIREELVHTVREIELRLRRRLDWRWSVQERPFSVVSAMFLLGLALGWRRCP